ncbi:hypothetical protein ACGFIV_01015 [Sphaerisporangium sp. NPDC049003]|uniref:hypothetical protein n=1 Tax=Sphaerisporangium sp. NPDC049003 TaxID=3364517 RepID=UPI003719CE1B
MAGTPKYTDPWPEEWGNIRTLINAAMTAAWSRIAFMKLVARELVVGAVTGRRIILNPDDGELPEVRFVTGTGDYASIVAGGDGGSGLEILGLASGTGQRYALRVADEELHVLYVDAAGNEDLGGRLLLNTSEAYVGYWGNGSDDENYFQFAGDGKTRHIGKWDANTGGTYWGMLLGAVRLGAGFGGISISWGPTMATETIPIPALGDLASNPAGVGWIVNNRDNTGFDINWAGGNNTTTREVTYMAYRTG